MKLIFSQVKLTLGAFILRVEAELSGPVMALCGPSGSGKTSLLELIAGWRRPERGVIQLDDTTLTDTFSSIQIPLRHRRIGYVPQDLGLFPHLTVRQNMLYGQGCHGGGTLETSRKWSFEQVANVLEVESLAERRVWQLSRGEQQRVSLGRALLAGPRLLLLDEPLSNLDRDLKIKILGHLKQVREIFGIPMIHVTHDDEEAMGLGGPVLRMRNGCLEPA